MSASFVVVQRGAHPANRHFTVLRIVGGWDLWVSECVIKYDGVPSYSVSILVFANGYVVHETQYFANAFGAPEWRTTLAESNAGQGHRQSVTWAGESSVSLRRTDGGRLRRLDSCYGADNANERDRNSSQRDQEHRP